MRENRIENRLRLRSQLTSRLKRVVCGRAARSSAYVAHANELYQFANNCCSYVNSQSVAALASRACHANSPYTILVLRARKTTREGTRENHRAPLKRKRDEEGGSAREYREGENIEQSCIND